MTNKINSKNKLKVLLVIDVYKREYKGMLKLKRELTSRGAKVSLISRHVVEYAFNQVKPDIVILPKSHKINFIEHIHKHAYVILLQAESFSGSGESLVTFSKQGWKTDCIDMVFTWGEYDTKIYKSEGIFKHQVMKITGHPMIEDWYNKKEAKEGFDTKKVIGISTSLRAMTHDSAVKSFVTNVCHVEENGASGFFESPYHAEAWVAYEACIIRLIYNIIKMYPENRIMIRPHPTESIDAYNFLKGMGNVSVCNSLSIFDWFSEIDVLLSYMSTSQLDAYVYGLHVITLKDAIPLHVQEGIPKYYKQLDHLFPSFTSVDDLGKIINTGYRPNSEIDLFLENVFNYPNGGRASRNISNYIFGELDLDFIFKNKRKFRPINVKHFRFVPNFFRKDHVLMLVRDFRDIFLGVNDNVGGSYCLHRELWKKFLKLWVS
jgi:surface carbohydrate biosynthesis protein